MIKRTIKTDKVNDPPPEPPINECVVCHIKLDNDTYGTRCEDCYAEGISNTERRSWKR